MDPRGLLVRLTSSQTWAIVGIASLIWLGLSVFGVTSGGGPSVVLSFADIIPALLFGALVYERWLWRWSPLHEARLVSTPVVIGTWKGDLEPFWELPKTHPRPPIKTAYLTIAQTATTVFVRLLTDESASEQLAGTVTKAESGYPAISYNYRNKPGMALRYTVSPIHYGGALIEIVGDPATGLKGDYWTDRKSRGEVKFREHSPEVAQTFEEAGKLTFGPPQPVGVLGRGLTRLLRRVTGRKAGP